MSRKVKHIVKKSFSVIMVLLIINSSMNAFYQISILNPESSCHTKAVEISCCEAETEMMSEAECSLNKWIGVHQISSCTCLHELNEQSSVILSSDKSNSKIIERIVYYTINDKTISKKDYFTNYCTENFRLNTTKIYLIDSSLLI